MAPQVSVIIPFLNAAWCIGDQLDALRHQTCQASWELLLVDNGSDDNFGAVFDRFLQNYPVPVRLIDAGHQRGVGFALNQGARAASAEWLAFCDADDRVHPLWLDSLYRSRRHGAISSGACSYWLPSSSIHDRSCERVWNSAAVAHLGVAPMAMSGNMLLSRSDYFWAGGVSEEWRTGEDAEFSWRFLVMGGAIQAVDDAVIDYRIRSSWRLTLLQFYRYGQDDVRLLCEYKRCFKAGGDSRLSPRLLFPFSQWRLLAIAILSGDSLRRHSIARTWGKYLGHLSGSMKMRTWIF